MDREEQGGHVGPTLSLYIYIIIREEQILGQWPSKFFFVFFYFLLFFF